ncbi:MAG: NnrS family protein [Magnetococcales bacterium]|nr:NnrS family protein [Magnetococcales bacterium]
MNKFVEKILPTDPPLQPMKLTREPIVNRYWATGLVGIVLGFVLGCFLWLWQQGILVSPDDYFNFKLSHARLQIILFAGSFLLGFALQAGPHVIGGPPPSSRTVIFFLPFLWAGTALSLLEDPVLRMAGNAMVSVAFAGPAYLLLNITLAGNPDFRIPRGIPIAASFLLLATSPWLELDDPGVALFVIWCGPITAVLVAAQQLTNNVLGGKLLQGQKSVLFAVALFLAWLASAGAAFFDDSYWRLSGILWAVVLYIQVKETDFIPSAMRQKFTSIQVVLLLAFSEIAISAIMPVLSGDDFIPDAAVHLLGAGVITTLILGVAARVAGFFCGDLVLRDRGLTYLLFAWTFLAVTRTLTSIGLGNSGWTMAMVYLGVVILIIWIVPMANRLIKIGKQFNPADNS